MRGRTNADGQGVALNANTRKCVVAQNQSVTEGDFVEFVPSEIGKLILPSSSKDIETTPSVFELSDGRFICFENGVCIVEKNGDQFSRTLSLFECYHNAWSKIDTDTFVGFDLTIEKTSEPKMKLVISAEIVKFDVATNTFSKSETISCKSDNLTTFKSSTIFKTRLWVENDTLYMCALIQSYSSTSYADIGVALIATTNYSGTSENDFVINSFSMKEYLSFRKPSSSARFLLGFVKTSYGLIFSYLGDGDSSNKGRMFLWDGDISHEIVSVEAELYPLYHENGYVYFVSKDYKWCKWKFTSFSEYTTYALTNIDNMIKPDSASSVVYEGFRHSILSDSLEKTRMLLLYRASTYMSFIVLDFDKTNHSLLGKETPKKNYGNSYYWDALDLGCFVVEEGEYLVLTDIGESSSYSSTLYDLHINSLGEISGNDSTDPVVKSITTLNYIKGVAKESGVGGEEIMVYTPFV